jgi:hypothetical protein
LEIALTDLQSLCGSLAQQIPKLAPKVISKAERYPFTERAKQTGKFTKYLCLKANLGRK